MFPDIENNPVNSSNSDSPKPIMSASARVLNRGQFPYADLIIDIVTMLSVAIAIVKLIATQLPLHIQIPA